MKKLQLTINIEGISFDASEKKKPCRELVVELLKNIILNKYAQSPMRGMSELDRYKFYKLSDILDKSVKDELDFLMLEDAEFEMILHSKQGSSLLPNEFLRRVEAMIDEAAKG